MPTISIAVATYNGEKFIKAQLDSLAAQTVVPTEIIVSDDGSKDATIDIVGRFSDSVPIDVKLLQHDTNVGYAANFGRALAATSGDIIFLCDQDDGWHTTKIERLTGYLADNPNMMCVLCDAELADGDLNGQGVTKMAQVEALNKPAEDFIMGCCIAMRKEFLDLLLPIPDKMRGHDNWLMFFADQLGVAARLREPLQLYRRHGANASNVPENVAGASRSVSYLWRQFLGRIRGFRSNQKLQEELYIVTKAHDRMTENHQAFAALLGSSEFQHGFQQLAQKRQMLEGRAHVRATGNPLARLFRALQIGRQHGGINTAHLIKDIAAATYPANQI